MKHTTFLSLVALFVLALFTVQTSALKFTLEAKTKGSPPRCVRDFVNKGKMVIVKAKVNGNRGDGQVVNLHIQDNKGNEYGRKKNVAGSEVSVAFTAHEDSAFDICFENVLTGNGRSYPAPSRDIELNVEIGSQARDWNQVQAAEKLKPTEAELRRIEEMTDEIQRELEYLKIRETRLRDTNESTNRRVKGFSLIVVLTLVGFGVWQILYLRRYFRAKHII